MAATLRRRRGVDAPNDDLDESDGKADGERVRETSRAEAPRRSRMTFARAFGVLLFARLASAAFNLVHDCDETYNFWEPLHYLTHGHGMQTWEHAPRFGLRSYAYAGAHALIAKPAAWFARHAIDANAAVADAAARRVARVAPFYAVRLVLAVASALADAALATRVSETHPLAGAVTLASLACSAGCFVSSTAFLPSAFAGLCVTRAMSANLRREDREACAWCVVAVVWGWPFAGVAAVPFGLECLRRRGVAKTLAYVAAPLAVTSAVSVAADTYFYGTPTWSVLNLLRYNVFPGGAAKGANLYGVEPATFYLKNLALNFAHGLVLALFAIPLGLLAGSSRFGRADGSRAGYVALLPTHAPFPLALLLFSALEHKEERFMYVVYSALCAGAGAAAGAAFDLCVAQSARERVAAKHAGRQPVSRGLVVLAAMGAGAVCVLTAALGASRVAALALGYGAPARAFAAGLPVLPGRRFATPGLGSTRPLETDDDAPRGHSGHRDTFNVCVGDEWHRFPSSFFFPSDAYRLQFLDASFDGALPVPFERARGGTAFGAPALNDANRGEKEQRVADARRECDYVVEYAPPTRGEAAEDAAEDAPRPYLGKPRRDATGEVVAASPSLPADDSRTLLWEAPFLDAARSPALSRAFFIPGWSSKRNVYGTYRVYEKTAR